MNGCCMSGADGGRHDTSCRSYWPCGCHKGLDEEEHTHVYSRPAPRRTLEALGPRCVVCKGSGRRARTARDAGLPPVGGYPCRSCRGTGRASLDDK